MGSLAKRLGQWSRKSFESESASIWKGLRANKVPGSLSRILDSTLQEGHDMKIFGIGTLATMASRQRYRQFLTNLHATYGTLEEELDATSIPAIQSETVRVVWKPHEQVLRRRDRFQQDLDELQTLLLNDGGSLPPARVSPCTLHYLQAIRLAGEVDRETGSGRLLGHLYCRYFADLFGGQMLGRPYELALQLPTAPRHLEFEIPVGRQALLEHLYRDLNKAGKLLTPLQLDDVRRECIMAFQHNIKVYSEQPGMMTGAAKGGLNCLLGWATSFSS